MKSRRTFLKETGALTLLGCSATTSFLGSAHPGEEETAAAAGREVFGFKRHLMRQGDGKGGWVLRPAKIRFVHYRKESFCAYGVAQMDNGEVVVVGDVDHGVPKNEKPAIAFSRDGGNTWTELKLIDESPQCWGRPCLLTYLGKGNLMFQTESEPIVQYFSSDYGRTWPERRPLQLALNGGPFNVEGNPLVDRDAKGMVTRIAAIGYNISAGKTWPKDPLVVMVRWSNDGGRTWTNESRPEIWRWKETYKGKTSTRGCSEGSLVRAKNGWLVAALRTDIPARYLDGPYTDHLCGTAISISKDDGATWSPLQVLYDAGRHHMNLLQLPNGDLVLTLIVRVDVQKGELATYGRGCEAIISHDNRFTWDLAHKYVLDEMQFYDSLDWTKATSGHLFSTLLDDGHILTCYGKCVFNFGRHPYLDMGGCLIKWKPTAP